MLKYKLKEVSHNWMHDKFRNIFWYVKSIKKWHKVVISYQKLEILLLPKTWSLKET